MNQTQKGQRKQTMGRSRGGLNTKIHAVVDTLGNPFRFGLTGGEAHDSVQGFNILKSMKLTGKQVLADRAYDTQILFGPFNVREGRTSY